MYNGQVSPIHMSLTLLIEDWDTIYSIQQWPQLPQIQSGCVPGCSDNKYKSSYMELFLTQISDDVSEIFENDNDFSIRQHIPSK